MSNMPTFIHKKMRCGCDKSLIPVSIHIAKNIKSPCGDYSQKKSLKSCIKSKDTSIHKKDQGNKIPMEVLRRLKIDLRMSEK